MEAEKTSKYVLVLGRSLFIGCQLSHEAKTTSRKTLLSRSWPLFVAKFTPGATAAEWVFSFLSVRHNSFPVPVFYTFFILVLRIPELPLLVVKLLTMFQSTPSVNNKGNNGQHEQKKE